MVRLCHTTRKSLSSRLQKISLRLSEADLAALVKEISVSTAIDLVIGLLIVGNRANAESWKKEDVSLADPEATSSSNAEDGHEARDTHDIGAVAQGGRAVLDIEGDIALPHLTRVPGHHHMTDTDVTDDHLTAVLNDNIVVVNLLCRNPTLQQPHRKWSNTEWNQI